MICVNCGRNVGADGFCTCCGFMNKHIAKANNTANYYYNLGLEKAQMHDLSGAISVLKKALTLNKAHKDARNLLGLCYYEMGEAGRAYIEWKKSARLVTEEQNVANRYIKDMEEHPAIFEEINETAKKYNLALSYAKQGSDDLAMIQIKKVLSITPKFVNGHLLFALLHMRADKNDAAKKDIENALAIDHYNTTAQRYLTELGGNPATAPKMIQVSDMRPDNDNLKNVRPVDHYEDPNKETWKQFVYMLIGLAIGIVAMFVLVIPSVRASVSVDYNALKKEYSQTVNQKDSEITQLQEDKATLEKKNKKLNRRLKVYEGSDGQDSMYDSLLKATQAYSENNYIECAKQLSNIDKDSLPSDTSKNLFSSMKEKAYPSASASLFSTGKANYDIYKYQDALKDLEDSYKYSNNDYEILYVVAMCNKHLGKTDISTEYFFDIINYSGDDDLIRRAANHGLDMLKEPAIAEAAKHKKGGNAASGDDEAADPNATGEEGQTGEDSPAPLQ